VSHLFKSYSNTPDSLVRVYMGIVVHAKEPQKGGPGGGWGNAQKTGRKGPVETCSAVKKKGTGKNCLPWVLKRIGLASHPNTGIRGDTENLCSSKGVE